MVASNSNSYSLFKVFGRAIVKSDLFLWRACKIALCISPVNSHVAVDFEFQVDGLLEIHGQAPLFQYTYNLLPCRYILTLIGSCPVTTVTTHTYTFSKKQIELCIPLKVDPIQRISVPAIRSKINAQVPSFRRNLRNQFQQFADSLIESICTPTVQPILRPHKQQLAVLGCCNEDFFSLHLGQQPQYFNYLLP